jgi:hypothetical protein
MCCRTAEAADALLERAFAADYMDDEAVAQERKRLTRQARLKAKRLSMMQELDALFVEFDQDGNGQIDRSQKLPPFGFSTSLCENRRLNLPRQAQVEKLTLIKKRFFWCVCL